MRSVSFCVLVSFAYAAQEYEQCEPDDKECRAAFKVFDLFGEWIDGIGDDINEAANFINENIFVDESASDEASKGILEEASDFFSNTFTTIKDVVQGDGDEQSLLDTLRDTVSTTLTASGSEKKGDDAVQTMLEQARLYATTSKLRRNFADIFKLFETAQKRAADAFDKHFAHIDFKNSLPISLWYYIEREDEVKTPTWKRKRHRFHKDVSVETIVGLHDALYLSHLTYVDTVEDIQNGLKDFDVPLELIYATVESFPGEPAHFIALVKRSSKGKWSRSNTLEVVMAVRGTKELGDIFSDVILDAADYRGGKTHEGVASGGKFLAETHLDLFKHLLKVSGKRKLRLWIVGHSLGAGAAAVAAIELNEHEFVEAKAVGFGCPALLTPELSESTKDYITTVVSDSDVVPRMSGATVSNMFLDVMSYDWTARAMEDTKQLLEVLNETIPFWDVPIDELLGMVDAYFDKHDRPHFDKVLKKRLNQELIPPGQCIHVYRDGIGRSAKYTPCSFFDSVDVTRSMIQDHMSTEGYHRSLLQFVRDQRNDVHFDFKHNLLALPA